MVRQGLGTNWRCLFANDWDPKKNEVYIKNWGAGEIVIGDIAGLSMEKTFGSTDLVWASFPCQDLSNAGSREGLTGKRSGAFFSLIKHIETLIKLERTPKIIALENVVGTLTSKSGKDFHVICRSLSDLGYSFGAVIIDAAWFLPQSRPRLFIIAVRTPPFLQTSVPKFSSVMHSKNLLEAVDRLPLELKKKWIWWQLPKPPIRKLQLADIILDAGKNQKWHSASETQKLLSLMSDRNLQKITHYIKKSGEFFGCVFKRMRLENGAKVQRAEIRFDNLAGCLRTPAGGSSRQILVCIKNGTVRSRLLSGRETARLMGLPDTYELPSSLNLTYHLTGDGVAIPAVSYLAENIFEPYLSYWR